MQQTIEAKADRSRPPAEALSITLGVERMAFPPRGGSQGPLRDLFLLMSKRTQPAAPEPALIQASAEPALLLTEADFAPPENVFAVVGRVAGFIAVAIVLGGAAFLGLSLLT